jgi:hypothetical protein
MMIIQVFLKPHAEHPDRSGPRGHPFRLLDVPGLSFDEIMAAFADDRLVLAEDLRTHFAEERGVRVISNRSRIALRGGAVDRAEVPGWRFMEQGREVPK